MVIWILTGFSNHLAGKNPGSAIITVDLFKLKQKIKKPKPCLSFGCCYSNNLVPTGRNPPAYYLCLPSLYFISLFSPTVQQQTDVCNWEGEMGV